MNYKLPFLIILLLALGFTACKKNNDAPSAEDTLAANLNVVNTTTDTLNYYLNGSRVNTTSSLYPFGSSGYVGVKIGEQNYQFKRLGNADVLFNLPLALDTNKSYSLYVSGRSAEQSFTSLDTIASDSLSRVKIRFVNASPDAGNLDVSFNDTLKFSVRPYKSISVFLPVTVGEKHIKVFKSGTTTAISDTTRTFTASRVYTLFAKGSLTGTGGAKFGTGLVVNR